MELQELTATAITVQVRFRLAPAFADKRGAMIAALCEAHGLSEYGWAETFLQVTNPEQTKRLVIGSRELRISYEHVERIDDFVTAAREFIEYGVTELALDELEFLGVRSHWLAAVDSFEELRDWLAAWLTPDNPVSAAVAAQPSDLGWIFEFRDQSPEYVARIGPMKVEQLLEQIFVTSQRDLFPEQFLFLDLDRVYRGDHAPSTADLIDRIKESLDRAVAVGERFGAAVQERLAAG